MSKETKFTEGEWVIYDVDDNWGANEGELIIGMASYNDDYSNHFCSHKILIEDSDAESIANAHLIAAAPEMYEMLLKLRDDVDNVIESAGWYFDNEELENIDKLLSKARGEA